jgi:hypothetical protein
MKCHAFMILILSALIVSCAPTPTPTPTKSIPSESPATLEVAVVIRVATATPQIVVVTATPEPTETQTPTNTPTITPTSTPTVTPIPQAALTKNVLLYSGPGNQGYVSLGQLKASSSVYLLGVYGDFVQVRTLDSTSSQTGFVAKTVLGEAATNLPTISPDQVPWLPVDITNNFMDPRAAFRNEVITISNNTSGYYDYLGSPISFDTRFRLTVQIQ